LRSVSAAVSSGSEATGNRTRVTVTLKQVAASAGVSYQTVWRALHNSAGILPDTRTQVLEVAERLGYRRNSLASGLRTSQSRLIGLIVLDVSNAYTSEMVSGIEAAATESGYSVLLMNSGDDVERERRAVASLMERRVDGLIMNPSSVGDHAYLRQELPAGFPLVALNRAIPGVPSVTIESRAQDAAEAARHLIAQGRTRLGGLFGNYTNTPFRQRSLAFRHAIELAGLPVRPAWFCEGDNTVEFARRAVRDLLSTKDAPTGLFAAGNRLTEGTLLGLRDLGLRQGQDVGLVGFDLRYAELLQPPMPVLLQPGQEIGRRALQAVLQLRLGKTPKRLQTLPLRLSLAGSPGDVTESAAADFSRLPGEPSSLSEVTPS
jgi:LacI family transcriptional regulator